MSHPMKPNPRDDRSPVRDEPRSRVALAPESCIALEPCLAADEVIIVATDLTGAVRARLHVRLADAPWWMKAARFLLALRYGAARIQLVKQG
jgi:hypothetical protein